jgi:hypothetical protein
MGEGVRELEDASDGEGVIEPSSEPRTERVSCSESSSTTSGGGRRDARVFTIEGFKDGSEAAARRAGRVAAVDTRCFGAKGGLFVPAGWNSMMGLSKISQLYCFASNRPLGRGIHVPRHTHVNKPIAGRRKQDSYLDIFHNRLGLFRVRPFEPRVLAHVYVAVCQIQRL